jgi:hypothetical protein
MLEISHGKGDAIHCLNVSNMPDKEQTEAETGIDIKEKETIIKATR